MANDQGLKILILTLFSPYPANDGGKICVFGFIDYLRKYHDFTCLIPVSDNFQYEEIEKLKELWPDVKILVADSRPKPEPIKPVESTQRGLLHKVIKKVANFNYRFFSRLLQDEKYVKATVKIPEPERDLMMDAGFSSPFAPVNKKYLLTLAEELESKNYDIIQVELSRNLNLINVLPKESIRIFEQIESRHAVVHDYLSVQGVEESYLKYVVETCEELENYFMSKYDTVLTLNIEDENYLRKKIPGVSVLTSPFGVLDIDLAKLPSTSMATKLVFSGSGFHYPNYDALKWYLEEMHNEVFMRTGLKLYITGIWPVDKMAILKEMYGDLIEIVGFVEDYNSFIADSIMIVPMRIGGGGLRTKILYSMANAVPVVSTSIGAFGIGVTHKENMLIADTSQDFIKEIVTYTQNNDFFKEVSSNSYDFFCRNYSQSATAERRNEIYKSLVSIKRNNLLPNSL